MTTTTTPSQDLSSIVYYGGRIFNEQDGVDLMAVFENRERKVRRVQGESFLTTEPALEIGPTPNTFELRLTGGEGVSRFKPWLNGTYADLGLEEANSGTLTGSTIVTTGAGYSRYLVVTAEWIGRAYDQKKDENQVSVFRLIDDAILWRVFMGAEDLTANAALPSGDLDTAFANTGAIPVAVVRRDFGDVAIGADQFFNHSDKLEHVVNTIGSINALARSIASQAQGATIRLIPDAPTYSAIDVKKILATPAIATNGGKISITPNVGIYVFLIEGKLRWYAPTVAFETDDLDVSSTYFLRAQLNIYGKLTFYVQKGTLPVASGNVYDSYPTNLRGTPDGVSGGGFPTTHNDILLGIITTGLAGSLPSWTPLYSGDFAYSLDVGYSLTPLIVDIAIPIPFSCEYEILIQMDEDNWQPTPPTANHKAFHPLGAKVNFYNYQNIQVEAKGRWLEDNAGNLRVATTDEFARPGYRAMIRPKHRDIS